MSGPRHRMLWNEERYFPNEWLHSLSISMSICLYLWFPAQAVSLPASLGPGRPLMIIITIIRVDSRGACMGQTQSRVSCWSTGLELLVLGCRDASLQDTHTHTRSSCQLRLSAVSHLHMYAGVYSFNWLSNLWFHFVFDWLITLMAPFPMSSEIHPVQKKKKEKKRVVLCI